MSTITFLLAVLAGLYSIIAYLNPAILERLSLPVSRRNRFWYLVVLAICVATLAGSWLFGIGAAILIWLLGDGADYLKRWFK